MSARARRSVEQHARVTWRIVEALIRGELTRDEFVLLVYIVGRISHDVWRRPIGEQILVTELAVIKAETNWTKTTARLAQVIDELVRKGWIGTKTRAGSKKREFWLTGAAIVELGEEVAENALPDFELSSKRAEPVETVKRRSGAESGSREPRNGGGSLHVDVDVETNLLYEEETSDLHSSEKESGAPELNHDRGGLLPDVLEAINRARVARGEETLERGPSFFDPISPEDEELIDRIADEVFRAP